MKKTEPKRKRKEKQRRKTMRFARPHQHISSSLSSMMIWKLCNKHGLLVTREPLHELLFEHDDMKIMQQAWLLGRTRTPARAAGRAWWFESHATSMVLCRTRTWKYSGTYRPGRVLPHTSGTFFCFSVCVKLLVVIRLLTSDHSRSSLKSLRVQIVVSASSFVPWGGLVPLRHKDEF